MKAAEVWSDRGVAWEGRVLGELSAACRPDREGAWLPRVIHFDETQGLLALDWLAGAETLHAYHRRTRRFGAATARSAGQGIGALHRLTALDPNRFAALSGWASGTDFADRILWTSPATYAGLTVANAALFGAVQADPVALRALRQLRDKHSSREGGCLVHGDLRQANLVRVAKGGRTRLVFIDWELACWGDPARDVGSLTADYLLAWVCPESEAVALGRAPLRHFLRALMSAYRRARGETFPFEPGFGVRVIQWAGEALLRYADTRGREEAGPDARADRYSAWALELLDRPERWASDLLGARA